MASLDKEIYSIYAIRLVNFHNINQVTIPIRNGGHLFLLGDNGSGKTTILDAIHYVLSAGELELNSAARLGGNKLDGRRINGVVTAYNIDFGGARFPDGRVTYAALELRNGAGGVCSIGIGLSIAGVGAPLQQWGFRMNIPVSELPLLIMENDGNEHPPNREEFKKNLGKRDGNYFSSMNAYAQMLARDFFPTQAQYLEYRKFLNMCKAYREISSKAGNYHELFKSLLPEPDTELLRELRSSLRNLKDSHSALMALEKRCEYLAKLSEEKNRIDRAGKEIRFLTLGILYFDCREQRLQWDAAGEVAGKMQTELKELEEEKKLAEESLQELERSLTDLKARDSSNLIETEKRRTSEFEQDEQKLQNLNARQEETRKEIEDIVNARQQELADYRESFRGIAGKLAENLDEWKALPIQHALSGMEQTQLEEHSYLNLELNPLRELHSAFGGQLEAHKISLTSLRDSLDKAQGQSKEAEAEVAALREQEEALPEHLPDYQEMLDDLERKMLDAHPLYEKLHWRSDVPPEMRGAVEELIGEETLGTVVADAQYAGRIKDLLLADYPGSRFAERNSEAFSPPSPRIHAFLDRFFDSSRDVSFLTILARELDGVDAPQLTSSQFTEWRGSFRVFCNRPARLIGEAERKAEQKRRLDDAEELLATRRMMQKAAERNIAGAEKRFKILQRFADRFSELFSSLQNATEELVRHDRRLKQLTEDVDSVRKDRETLTTSLKEQNRILQQLRRQIREGDLESLNAEITRLDATCQEVKERCRKNHDNWIKLKTRQEDHALRLNALAERAEQLSTELNQLLATEKECSTLEALEKYLHSKQLNSTRKCDAEIIDYRRSIGVCVGTLRTLIASAEGVDYGFTYDEAGNELYSRENKTIGALLERRREDLAQQREILTTETRKSFERILLEGFRDSLRKRIYSLEHMHRQINLRLKNHHFGDNTYSLKIEELPEYVPLVKVLRSFSEQSSESAEELKEIFDHHADEILATPADRMPPILDYRNYFRYEMLLHSGTREGKVMDGRTKSIGSGGEQAVPNYLLVMMIAHLLFDKTENSSARIRINTILFDEAFYGIDLLRQSQLLSFAEELGLQLGIASPNQDGVKPELANSTNVFVQKDKHYQVHLFGYNWQREKELFGGEQNETMSEELT